MPSMTRGTILFFLLLGRIASLVAATTPSQDLDSLRSSFAVIVEFREDRNSTRVNQLERKLQETLPQQQIFVTFHPESNVTLATILVRLKHQDFELPSATPVAQIISAIQERILVKIRTIKSPVELQRIKEDRNVVIVFAEHHNYSQLNATMLVDTQVLQLLDINRLFLCPIEQTSLSRGSVILNGFGNVPEFLGDIAELDDIVSYVRLQANPTVTRLTPQNYLQVIGSHQQILLLFSFETKSTKSFLTNFHAAAQHNRFHDLRYKRVLFVMVDDPQVQNALSEFEVKEYSVSSTQYMVLVHLRGLEASRYLVDADSKVGIIDRLEECRTNKCDRLLLTEEPVVDRDGDYITLVGRNIESTIRKTNHSFLLYVWDSREGKMNSKLKRGVDQAWAKLDAKMKGSKLSLGIFDAGKNQSPFVRVNQIPQIVLFYYEEGKMTKNYFRGRPDEDDITYFLQLHKPELFPELAEKEEILALG